MPPTGAKLERLIQEVLARRDKALREDLARRGMTMADLEEDRGWDPLETTRGRLRDGEGAASTNRLRASPGRRTITRDPTCRPDGQRRK